MKTIIIYILLLLSIIIQNINCSNIHGFIEGSCDNNLGCGNDAPRLVLGFVFLTFLSMLIVYGVIKLNYHFIPESLVVVVYGVIIGIIIKYWDNKILNHLGTYNPNDFFLFILPFIIFETGFSLPKYYFFKNIKAILILSVIGTVIVFTGTAFGLYGLGKAHLSPNLSIYDSLLISSILCATDPIATLAIFKALDVEPSLFMIVLGESIINDAAAVIIYEAVLDYKVYEIWKPILLFFGVFAGSLAVGIIVALLLALLLKYIDVGSFPALELIFIFIFSYSSYLIGDSFYLSGILASFFCGMTSSQYVYKSLSNETKHSITQIYRMVAFVGETIVFIYIGIALPDFQFQVRVDFLAWTVLLLLLFRAISIFPTFLILNYLVDRNKDKISFAIQIIIWVSGLRGAISFSLMEENEINEHSNNARLLKTDILLTVYITLFLYGSLTYPLLKLLNIRVGTSGDQTLQSINTTFNFQNSRFHFIGHHFVRLDSKLVHFFSRNHPPERIVHTEQINDNNEMLENYGTEDNELSQLETFDDSGTTSDDHTESDISSTVSNDNTHNMEIR